MFSKVFVGTLLAQLWVWHSLSQSHFASMSPIQLALVVASGLELASVLHRIFFACFGKAATSL